MGHRVRARCAEHDVVMSSVEEHLAHLDEAHDGKWSPVRWEGFEPPEPRLRGLLRRLIR